MRLSRQKKSGTSGTADGLQGRLEKVFKLPEESTSLNVFSRDDKGRIQYVDSIPLSDVTASTLLDVIKQGYGGGRFQIVPMGGDKKAGESFEVNVQGESKLKKKPRADQDGGGKGTSKTEKEIEELKRKVEDMEAEKWEDRVIQEIRSLGEKIQSTDGKKDISVAEVMESVSATVKNLQSAVPQGPDPMEQVSQIADLIFKIGRDSRAPVSPTGTGQQQTGGGLSSFIASVIGEVEKRYLGGMAAAPPGGPVPALAPTGPGFAGSPAPSREQASFDGFADGGKEQQGAATEQPQKTEESANMLAGFDMKSLGVDPLARLRDKLLSRDDVEEVAEVAVYLLNFVAEFAVPDSPIGIYIQNFFAHPAMMFDQAAPLIPELHGASAQYVSDLRKAIVEEAGVYVRAKAEETAAPGADRGVWQADHSEKKTLTPEERQAQEEASREREAADEKVEDTEPKVEHAEAESEVVEEAQP